MKRRVNALFPAHRLTENAATGQSGIGTDTGGSSKNGWTAGGQHRRLETGGGYAMSG